MIQQIMFQDFEKLQSYFIQTNYKIISIQFIDNYYLVFFQAYENK